MALPQISSPGEFLLKFFNNLPDHNKSSITIVVADEHWDRQLMLRAGSRWAQCLRAKSFTGGNKL